MAHTDLARACRAQLVAQDRQENGTSAMNETTASPIDAEPVITADYYDAAYYGCDPDRQPKANYHNYAPSSVPHWSLPLARWLALRAEPPLLELGCCYGTLVRDCNNLGLGALGVEWSAWATAHAVSGRVVRGDARRLTDVLAGQTFSSVVSLDFLEHFTPEETISVMAQAVAVMRPGGRQFHLVGTPDAAGHHDDPSHLNHEPIGWYQEQFEALGLRLDKTMTAALNAHPSWRNTDWSGRWLALNDGRAH